MGIAREVLRRQEATAAGKKPSTSLSIFLEISNLEIVHGSENSASRQQFQERAVASDNGFVLQHSVADTMEAMICNELWT